MDSPSAVDNPFRLSEVVEVESRTWPGINKPGGIGRVTRLHTAEATREVTHVDVNYIVLGGAERHIPIKYVHHKPDFDAAQLQPRPGRTRSNLRDRSMLLGRCKRCGSLRTDCGYCDWIEQEQQLGQDSSNDESSENSIKQQFSHNRRRARYVSPSGQEGEIQSALSSSSSDTSTVDTVVSNSKRNSYVRQHLYSRTLGSKWRKVLESDSGSDTSASDDCPSPSDYARGRLVGNISSGRSVSSSNTPLWRHRKRKQRGAAPKDSDISDSSESDLDEIQTDGSVDVWTSTVEGGQDPTILPLQHPSSLSLNPESPALKETPLEVMDDLMQPLNDFIQPEGRHVAENLPQDTLDKTTFLEFGDLPPFFDRTAAQVKELLPQCRLRFEDLKTRLLSLGVCSSDGENIKTMCDLEKESLESYQHFKQKLIRDGTDQCVRAIRRLRDRKQRRLHKSVLTDEQKLQCRSSALDTKDILLDNLSSDVEQLMHEMRLMLAEIGSQLKHSDANDNVSFDSDTSYNGAFSTQLKTFEARDTDNTPPSARDLPIFDPHMHATIVRTDRQNLRQKTRSHLASDMKAPGKGSKKRNPVRKRGPSSRFVQKRKRKRKRRKPLTSLGPNDDVNLCLSSDNSESSLESRLFTDENGLSPGVGPLHTSEPPPLDSILRREGSASDRIDRSSGKQMRCRPSESTIADRMQAFLDVNLSGITAEHDNITPPRAGEERDWLPRSTYRPSDCNQLVSKNSSHMRTSNAISGVFQSQSSTTRVKESGRGKQTSLTTNLFRQMKRRSKEGRPQSRTANESNMNIHDMCKELAHSYSNATSRCWDMIDSMQNWLSTHSADGRSQAVMIYDAVLELLHKKGLHTLAELLHTDIISFRTHVLLLSKVVTFAEPNLSHFLRPGDGLSYKIFNTEAQRFLHIITLQVLDVAYSQLLPAAWASTTNRRVDVFKLMSPLRDALGRMVPQVESAAKLIMIRLECQQWWNLDHRDHAFVSSVNPDHYKSFLKTGVDPVGAFDVRFEKLKNSMPRIEIDAVWSLLAYFAGTATLKLHVADSDYRWRLLAHLFYRKTGVLSPLTLSSPAVEGGKFLAPSRAQIRSCESEIEYLQSLLSAGSLNPLPRTDTFPMNIITKAITLQFEEFLYNKARTDSLWPPRPTRDDFECVMKLFSDTRSCLRCVHQGELTATATKYKNSRQRRGPFDSVQPSSYLVNACLSLLISWIDHIPTAKARMSRVKMKTLELVSLLEDKAQAQAQATLSQKADSPCKGQKRFEEAFFASSEENAHMSLFRQDAFLRECGSNLMVALTVSKLVPGEGLLQLSGQFREKVWSLHADEILKQRQTTISSGIYHSVEEPLGSEYIGPVHPLFVLAKQVALVTWLHLAPSSNLIRNNGASVEYSNDLLSRIDPDDDMLVFLVSCLISSLDCLCDVYAKENKDPPITSRRRDVCPRVLSSVLAWLSVIFNRAQTIVAFLKTSSNHPINKLGPSVVKLGKRIMGMSALVLRRSIECIQDDSSYSDSLDICFRLSLTALLSTISFARTADEESLKGNITAGQDCQRNSIMGSKELEDPEFLGDLDDDAFLQMDIEGLAHRSVTNEKSVTVCSRSDYQRFEKASITRLFSFLRGCLNLAKPSNRFTVEKTAGFSGKRLAVRHAGGICTCLAALCIWDIDESSFISSLHSLLCPVLQTDNVEDHQYMKTIAQQFLFELCGLSHEFYACKNMLSKTMRYAVSRFVEALLDTDTLERFPSSDLNGIKDGGGSHREHRRLQRLFEDKCKLGGESVSPDIDGMSLRRRKHEIADFLGPSFVVQCIWSSGERLGLALTRRNSFTRTGATRAAGAIGKVLLCSDADLAQQPQDGFQQPSLERECIRRLRKVRSILSATARLDVVQDSASADTLDFENMAFTTISSASQNLLRVFEAINYFCSDEDNIHIVQGNQRDQDKLAKLLVLQSCYAHLTVGLLGWALQECNYSQCSKNLKDCLRLVRDDFFSRVLRRQNIDLREILIRLSMFPENIAVTRVSSHGGITESGNAKILLGIIRDAIVLHSRGLMVHVASLLQSRHCCVDVMYIFNALMAAGTENLAQAEKAGTSKHSEFTEYSFHDFPRPIERVPGLQLVNPFVREAYEYFGFVEISRSSESHDSEAMPRLRRYALRSFLVPTVCHPKTTLSKRNGCLQMLSHLLRIQSSSSIDESVVDSELASSIATALFVCLRYHLEALEFEYALLKEIIESSSLLLSLPREVNFVGTHNVRSHSFLCWIKSLSMPMPTDEFRADFSDHLCVEDVRKINLSRFKVCLESFAELLVHDELHATCQLQKIREKAIDLKSKSKCLWTDSRELELLFKDLSPKAKDFVIAAHDLEAIRQIPSSNKENVASVTNMYRTPSNRDLADASSRVEVWTANDELKTSARALLDKFQ